MKTPTRKEVQTEVRFLFEGGHEGVRWKLEQISRS